MDLAIIHDAIEYFDHVVMITDAWIQHILVCIQLIFILYALFIRSLIITDDWKESYVWARLDGFVDGDVLSF